MPAPQVITPADATAAGFLQSVASTVASSYDTVTALLTDTTKPTATKFQAHHRAHADALAKQGGIPTGKLTNPALELVLAARLQSVTDERGALTFASELENQVTVTYAFALTSLASLDVVHLVATILPIVSSHSLVLGSLAGIASTALFPNGAMEGTRVGDGADTKLGFDPVSFPAA
jgi:hypothetical protein